MAAILSDFYCADYGNVYIAQKDVGRYHSTYWAVLGRFLYGIFYIYFDFLNLEYSDSNQADSGRIADNDGFFANLAIQSPHR